MILEREEASPHASIETTLVYVQEDPSLPILVEAEEHSLQRDGVLPDTTTIYEEWRVMAQSQPERAFERMLHLLSDRATALITWTTELQMELGQLIAVGDQIGLHRGILKGSYETGYANMFDWLVNGIGLSKQHVRQSIAIYQTSLCFKEFGVPLELLGHVSSAHMQRILADERDTARQVQHIEQEKLAERGYASKQELPLAEYDTFNQEISEQYLAQGYANIMHTIEQPESALIEDAHVKGTSKKPYMVVRVSMDTDNNILSWQKGWMSLDGDTNIGLAKNQLILKFLIDEREEPLSQAELARYIDEHYPPRLIENEEDED